MNQERPNVLVLYGLMTYPVRQWSLDHIYSFSRYGSARYFHVNVGVRRVPRWLRSVKWDAVILHHTLTGYRMQPPVLRWQLKRAAAVKGLAPTTIAMIQDECIYTDLMTELIEDFEVDHVFTLAPESEWRKIYNGVDFDRVRFHRALAGYLDPGTIKRAETFIAEAPERPVDLGYRAWGGLMSLGRHGLLRRRLAEVFAPAADARGMKTDISVDQGATHFGDSWYRYLASCKYLLGAEGGATVLDPTGEYMIRTERYLAKHPGAGFDEVEANCFPGEDGKLALFAISPRHLEACATRTCQVLVEGEYSGVLKPNEHYIPIKRDLSDVEEVLDRIQEDSERERITENAYRDVVESGLYTYGGLVEMLERETGIAGATPREAPRRSLLRRHAAGVRLDKASWPLVAAFVRTVRGVRGIGQSVLPERIKEQIRDRFVGGEKLPLTLPPKTVEQTTERNENP